MDRGSSRRSCRAAPLACLDHRPAGRLTSGWRVCPTDSSNSTESRPSQGMSGCYNTCICLANMFLKKWAVSSFSFSLFFFPQIWVDSTGIFDWRKKMKSNTGTRHPWKSKFSCRKLLYIETVVLHFLVLETTNHYILDLHKTKFSLRTLKIPSSYFYPFETATTGWPGLSGTSI